MACILTTRSKRGIGAALATDAQLSPQEVAKGIINLEERVTLEQTGNFFHRAGEERAL